MDEPNGVGNSMKAVGRQAETHKLMKPLRMEWNEESQNREDKDDFPYGVRRLLCFWQSRDAGSSVATRCLARKLGIEEQRNSGLDLKMPLNT